MCYTLISSRALAKHSLFSKLVTIIINKSITWTENKLWQLFPPELKFSLFKWFKSSLPRKFVKKTPLKVSYRFPSLRVTSVSLGALARPIDGKWSASHSSQRWNRWVLSSDVTLSSLRRCLWTALRWGALIWRRLGTTNNVSWEGCACSNWIPQT